MSLAQRYDFVLFFDVQDGNPNGDPDAGNLPRTDPETGHGLVTDVCLKRKIRNYVSIAKTDMPKYRIFITEKAVLNKLIELEGTDCEAPDATPPSAAADGAAAAGKAPKKAKVVKKGKRTGEAVDAARNKMCELYFDVRTFGAVMSTGSNAGQVRGPVQLTFARSVDPIVTLEHSITRMAVATEEEAASQGGDNRTMGRKNTVPYGLYRAHGFISPALAGQTGFSGEDLSLLWSALESMFEHDRSAARGMMSTRALVIFEHASPLGDAPAHTLFDQVKAVKTTAVPRAFSDYALTINGNAVTKIRTTITVPAST